MVNGQIGKGAGLLSGSVLLGIAGKTLYGVCPAATIACSFALAGARIFSAADAVKNA